MKRIDWLVGLRVLGRITLVVLVFYGMIALAESLNHGRFRGLSERAGVGMAISAIFATAARWTIHTLNISVLIGTIIALVDLAAHRELLVAKATGLSIWRLLRGPVALISGLGLAVAFGADAVTVMIARDISPSPPDLRSTIRGNHIWFEQGTGDRRYIIHALSVDAARGALHNVEVFLIADPDGGMIRAPHAQLTTEGWRFSEAVWMRSDRPSEDPGAIVLPTQSTRADLALLLASTRDMTIYEMIGARAAGITDSVLRAAVETRLAKLLALPILLVGSLLIAFAATAGYRRTNSYGVAIISGIIAGSVVFVITEMAERAGSAGVLDPMVAAFGPAIVATVVGVTVLLRKEDGRA